MAPLMVGRAGQNLQARVASGQPKSSGWPVALYIPTFKIKINFTRAESKTKDADELPKTAFIKQ